MILMLMDVHAQVPDVGEPNSAKGPKMSQPGHDFTEANSQAGGVEDSLHVMSLNSLDFFRQRVLLLWYTFPGSPKTKLGTSTLQSC